MCSAPVALTENMKPHVASSPTTSLLPGRVETSALTLSTSCGPRRCDVTAKTPPETPQDKTFDGIGIRTEKSSEVTESDNDARRPSKGPERSDEPTSPRRRYALVSRKEVINEALISPNNPNRNTSPPANVMYSDNIRPTPPLEQFKLQGDGNSDKIIYGKGTWSEVVQALYMVPGRKGSSAGWEPPSPPDSPTKGSLRMSNTTRVIAVKKPRTEVIENAIPVLLKEARIVTYLQSTRAVDYIVPFLGFEVATTSILYEAYPVTLLDFSRQRLRSIVNDHSSESIRKPAVGLWQWLHLAHQLVTGLQHLHDAQVVHGDVKPQNILMRTSSIAKSEDNPSMMDGRELYDAIYCDFSSSHVEQTGRQAPPVSAITPEYTAPELIESFSSASAIPSVATRSADVYGLGVCLLVAATGAELYGATTPAARSLAMARFGQPIQFAQNTEQGARVMRGSTVERLVKGAVIKQPAENRCSAATWRVLVEEEMKVLPQTS